jgi:hypothetical protein
MEHIEQRLADLEDMPQDARTDELMAEAQQLEEHRDELDGANCFAVYAEKDRARAGCIVTIGYE